jgi:hypothetical protein
VTNYRIDPRGINAVLKRVEGVVADDLAASLKTVCDAFDEATIGVGDSNSPVMGALKTAQGRAAMAVRGVGTETAFIMRIAVKAASEYVKADDLMASRASHRSAAAHDVEPIARAPWVEEKIRQVERLP